MSNSSRRKWLSGALGTAAAMAMQAQSPQNEPAKTDELTALTLKQASDLIRTKKVSPVELTEACLSRIKTYNPKINAWITVMREQAVAQAKELEKEQMAGKLRSPLHGIPVGLKDTIDTVGVRTTAASAVYEYRFPTEDAEVARRLKTAGAVLAGKCNLHEFDAGPTSAVSYWGPVRNPWNLERVSGGPSGGSAAAVAMSLCFAALGTDTSGGIRGPAAYCGVVGFMPTYGRVSQRGIVPLAWSLDSCGPLARTVEDAALLLGQIAGFDVRDIDSVESPVPDFSTAIGSRVSEFRLGVAPQFFDHLDSEIAQALENAMAILNKLARGWRQVSLPSLLRSGVEAEIAAYHENLRGVNGGGYEPLTARAFPASAEAAKAVDYIRGWRDLQMVRRTVDENLFQKQSIDLLIAPTMRRGCPTVEESLVTAGGGGAAGERAAVGGAGTGGGNAVARPRLDLEENTRPFNGYGLPVITVPCGFTKAGMPIGLQICGPRFAETKVLALAHAYQEATDWHKRKPPLQPDTKVPTLSKAAADQTGG